MPGRSACPKAAEAKVIRLVAGRCRACGSRSHFGGRYCLTDGATTDHSPNLAFVRRHRARPETAVQLQYLQNCSAAVLPRIQWPPPFLKHWIRGLPIFFNPSCGPKPILSCAFAEMGPTVPQRITRKMPLAEPGCYDTRSFLGTVPMCNLRCRTPQCTIGKF